MTTPAALRAALERLREAIPRWIAPAWSESLLADLALVAAAVETGARAVELLWETLEALDDYLPVESEQIGRLDIFLDETLPRLSDAIRAHMAIGEKPVTRGQCAVCGKLYGLTKDGKVRAHGDCEGGGIEPRRAEQADG